MNEKIELGKINQLKISYKADPGLYLIARNEEKVLLPNAYCLPTMEDGLTINVFVYKDSEDRLVATTLTPFAKLNEIASLRVTDVTKIGAFCNWGLPKELFVPNLFQRTPFEVGEERIIMVIKDKRTDRLVGTQKYEKYLSQKKPNYRVGEKLNSIIVSKTPLGYKAIIENKFEGLLYEDEIFENIKVGQEKEIYIKKVREDGKIDLSLTPITNKDEFAKEAILEALRKNDYSLNLTTKSPPEEIYELVKLSKKNFKKAYNELLNEGVITPTNSGFSFLTASKHSKKLPKV
ncbi:MAG: S1-like domain-containing RNA-binding protein [Sulfurospirillaceae bacterium]|nr:S1-like domain-containing RNA-binding protein [Sulfurospirillaceae bacterium]